MIDERTLNLINADVDGELTAAEKEELDRTLEGSAEARAMRNELLKLGNLLSNVPSQSPPPGLRAKILDQLRPPKAVSRFSLGALFESLQPLPMGVAFVAGLLLTAGFYEMSAERTAPGSAASMVGTMVTGKAGGLNLLENNLYFSSDDFSGTVSLVENNGLYVLNFDLDSRDRKQIEVGLDRTGLSFGGFAETPGNSDNVIDSVSIAGGTLRVASQGRQKFAVFLRETGRGQKVAAELITIDFSGVERLAPASDSES
jgi:hypothetical protein